MGVNELGQPIGDIVQGWTAPAVPSATVLKGHYCRLERLDPEKHAEQLFAADSLDTDGGSWTYLPYGPFRDLASYQDWVTVKSRSTDPMFYAVVTTDAAGDAAVDAAVGVLSYLRITPAAGSIEVGHVHYSPLLQRQRAATEAQFLLMHHVFEDLGYRRYEWKCDALNAPSRAAAQRLGFCYEGRFRQATVVKGRNRDTAWYAITDIDWPHVQHALTTWLHSDNFDEFARQREPLRARPERT
ncbi:GNAT family N-acetyltransferase [Leekyejoonella antrihumi]|uniref:GNAT family N-acetyltransferase n=1 Tax=Leekyejoonella antrihumi TaxID=1660198 RepID=A0A563E6I7_9MICO|nr:GNAT family protein [Leekyejoonella antrihumi]TWP37873.1 GNAT family N-acetyltransferase [Leekyejoonella antrihumi]